MALNNYGMGFIVSAKDQASPALANVADKLSKTDQAAKKTKVSFEDIGSEAGSVGAKLSLAGAAGVAGLGLAAQTAAKFEFGVAQVATEADKAKLPMQAINDIAKKMALAYGGELDTQVKALYQGVAAGADDAAKATALLDGANRLAIAGNTDQATSILGITKVLNNYGLSFDKATDVADAFFVAVKGGQTTVGELGNAIGEVAALSKNAGLSMEEMIGALGTAATLGRDTAGSAASLKAALSGIAHPTADAAAEAQRLGIKFDAVTLRSKGLVGFLKQITSSSKYTADSMNKLFGSMEAAGFMQSLVANNSEQLSAMMDGMSKKAGGAQQAFELMSSTLQQQGSILKANVEVAMTELGEALLPLVKKLTGFLLLAVKAFANLPAPIKKAIAIGVLLASVLLTVTGALLGVVSGIAAAAAAGEALAIALAATVGIMAQWVAIMGVLVGAFMLFKTAYEENLGGFATFVDGVYAKVKLAFDALTQLFESGAFSGAVLKELKKSENAGIKDFAIQVFLWFNRIKNFFTGFVDGMEAGMQELRPAFTVLTSALEDLGKALGITRDRPEEASKAFNQFGKMGERVAGIIKDVAAIVISAITGIVNAVRVAVVIFGYMRKAGLPLSSALGSLFDSLVRVGEALGIVSKGATGSTSAWEVFGLVIGTVIGGVVNWIAKLINYFAALVAVGAAVLGGVIQQFQGLWNFLAGFSDFFTGVLSGNWDMALTGMKRMVFGFVQFVIGIFNVLAGSVFAVVDKIAQAFGKTSDLAGDLKKETGSILNSVQQGLGLTTATGGQDRRPLPVVGQANPSAGLAGVSAATQAALAKDGQQPLQAVITVPVMLDGDKIGEANAKYDSGQKARSGAPNPNPVAT